MRGTWAAAPGQGAPLEDDCHLLGLKSGGYRIVCVCVKNKRLREYLQPPRWCLKSWDINTVVSDMTASFSKTEGEG